MVAIVAAVIVLLLAVSAGVIVVAQLWRQPVTPTPTPNPTETTAVTITPGPTATPTPPFVPGQWVQVLTGYNVLSLAAAPSHPNVLYACASPARATSTGTTVLRSADFGNHWQDIGVRAQMGKGSCELAINPTDSFEIYVVTSSNPAAGSSVQVSASADPSSQENWFQEFWRYDTASRTWSKITQGPRGGVPLAVTPTDANGGIAVWVVRSATGTGQPVLYRYVI